MFSSMLGGAFMGFSGMMSMMGPLMMALMATMLRAMEQMFAWMNP